MIKAPSLVGLNTSIEIIEYTSGILQKYSQELYLKYKKYLPSVQSHAQLVICSKVILEELNSFFRKSLKGGYEVIIINKKNGLEDNLIYNHFFIFPSDFGVYSKAHQKRQIQIFDRVAIRCKKEPNFNLWEYPLYEEEDDKVNGETFSILEDFLCESLPQDHEGVPFGLYLDLDNYVEPFLYKVEKL